MIFAEVGEYRIRRTDPLNIVVERSEQVEGKLPVITKNTGRYKYTIIEHTSDDEGVYRRWKVLGYYSTMRQALRSLPDWIALDARITEIRDLYERWDEALKGLKL